MKTIVLYYSYKGHTKAVAQKMAKAQGAEAVEIQTKKVKSMVATAFFDCPRAMMRKAVPIKPITKNLAGYDRIILAAPVWAGNPAPAFNAMVKLLPKGKEVKVVLVSKGGETEKSAAGTKALIEKQGCRVAGYEDVKEPA